MVALIAKVPLTGIILIMELTRQTSLSVPLAITVAAALVTRKMLPHH
jgi:H+/Cl- antiporter ClcA